MGNPGSPQPVASALASARNSSVQIATAGMPWRSSSMQSWIHHDVQEPQSQTAPTTASHSRTNASVNVAGSEASFMNQRN